MIGLVAVAGIRIAAALEAGVYAVGGAVRAMASAAEPVMARAGNTAFIAAEKTLIGTGHAIRSGAQTVRGMYLTREERYALEARGGYQESWFSHYRDYSPATHRYEAIQLDVMEEASYGQRLMRDYGIDVDTGLNIQALRMIAYADEYDDEYDYDYGYDYDAFSEATGRRYNRKKARHYAKLIRTANSSESDVFDIVAAQLDIEYHRAADDAFDEMVEEYWNRKAADRWL